MTPETRPRLLDGCCGAGGAAKGYADAGWDVVGVDSVPMPRFPYEFVQCDVFEFIADNWRDFDAIHVSPPCQRKSAMTRCRPGLAAKYPNLVNPLRMILDHIGLPYVIENVEGSDVRPDVTLCGTMFGLPLYRHRVFESNMPLWQPAEPRHLIPASKAGHWRPGTIMSVSGHVSPMAVAREAMGGIDWMTRDELAEAIPAQYTEFLGAQLLAALDLEVSS